MYDDNGKLELGEQAYDRWRASPVTDKYMMACDMAFMLSMVRQDPSALAGLAQELRQAIQTGFIGSPSSLLVRLDETASVLKAEAMSAYLLGHPDDRRLALQLARHVVTDMMPRLRARLEREKQDGTEGSKRTSSTQGEEDPDGRIPNSTPDEARLAAHQTGEGDPQD